MHEARVGKGRAGGAGAPFWVGTGCDKHVPTWSLRALVQGDTFTTGPNRRSPFAGWAIALLSYHLYVRRGAWLANHLPGQQVQCCISQPASGKCRFLLISVPLLLGCRFSHHVPVPAERATRRKNMAMTWAVGACAKRTDRARAEATPPLPGNLHQCLCTRFAPLHGAQPAALAAPTYAVRWSLGSVGTPFCVCVPLACLAAPFPQPQKHTVHVVRPTPPGACAYRLGGTPTDAMLPCALSLHYLQAWIRAAVAQMGNKEVGGGVRCVRQRFI